MSEAFVKFITKLNSILKDKSTEEIIKIFPSIKNLILKELNIIADQYNLNETDRQLFIQQKIKEFKIKGIPLEMYEKSWEEKNHFLEDYKKLYDVANKLGIFPKKLISINVNGNPIDIEVLDTGKKFIPSSDFDISLDIIQALNDLKNNVKEFKKEIKQNFSNTENEIINDFNTTIDIINNQVNNNEEIKSL